MRDLGLSLLLVSLLWSVHSAASPNLVPGDVVQRNDIQTLADAGIISGPVSTWPLAWGPIADEIRRADLSKELPTNVFQALMRIRDRLDWETRTGEITYQATIAVAENPTRIRSFQNTPRESTQTGGAISWTGNRLAISLAGQVIDNPGDGKIYRMDGSSIGVIVGNYSIGANTLDRWWGPGWDSNLILSSNARPIPSISIDRVFTDPFRTKWLSWLGPWDLAIHYGQLESEREIPDARFFGMRINFKPLPSLEVGLSRTAQWCGRGRPCGFDTFADTLLGIDNIGGQGVTAANEPGNQLAGMDFRWATKVLGMPVAFYGQLIGEDEAGGLPSRYLGQVGIEAGGMFDTNWSYRWFGEFAGTSCQFHESSEIFNCAYNHSIYKTGYRYRGRAIGHGADNDARIVSTGLMLSSVDSSQWDVLARFGALNRGGLADVRNSLTQQRQDIASIDFSYRRAFTFGRVSMGLGIERLETEYSGEKNNEGRVFLQWQSDY